MTYLAQFPNATLLPGAPLRTRTRPSRVRGFGPGRLRLMKVPLKQNILQPSSIFYNLLPYSTTFFHILQPSSIFHNLLLYSTTFFHILQPSSIFYNLLPYSTTFFHILQPSSIFYNLLPYSTTFFHILQPSSIIYNLLPCSTTFFFNLPHVLYIFIFFLVQVWRDQECEWER